MTITTRASLLERMRDSRDQLAWREFYAAYVPMLLSLTRRLGLTEADAEDAVHNCIIAVYDRFRRDPEPFDRSRAGFRAWLRGIVRHKVQHMRRAHARQHREPGAMAEPPSDSPDFDSAFEAEWQRSQLARGLEQVRREIDPAVYQAFELYACQNQPPERVAALLGISRNAVYISKTRVLQRLRRIITELQEEEG
jgi:RNA polymerase sigma-70 factor, ECF subfamily